MPVNEFQRRTIPLSGRLILSDDGIAIGENFQLLNNLRYTDTHKKMVLGMTKINTTIPTTYFKARSAHHLRKFQPAESHILVQAYNTGLTQGVILDNTTAVPGAGDFSGTSLFTETAGHGVGRFSDAPDGHAAYCNGKEACVWAGNEMRVARFVSFTTDLTTIKDYTEQVTNALTDSNNVATLVTESVSGFNRANLYLGCLRPIKGAKLYVATANTTVTGSGTTDANTMLLLHGDGANGGTTFTDSSPTSPHTVTANGNAQTSTAQKKFGTASALFDGAGDYLSIPDNADFNLSAGEWSIDFWMYPTGPYPSPSAVLYYQQTDANNYFQISYETISAVKHTIALKIVAGGATVVSVAGNTNIKKNKQFYHVEVTQSAGKYYVFVDGSQDAAVTDADNPANYTGSVYIGADSVGAHGYAGHLDEIRVSSVARHTSHFSVETGAYDSVAARGSYWDGTTWAGVTTFVDGTVTGSKTLAQTGTVSFDSTVGLAKPLLINETFLFWYRLTFDYVDANAVTLSQVTVDAPFQPAQDLWDGATRQIGAAISQTTATSGIKDWTTHVFEDTYDSTNTATYMLPGAVEATGYFEFGFTEQQTALRFSIVEDFANAAVNTIATVSYWDGNAFQPVDGLVDKTSADGVTLARSGTMSWSAPDRATEFSRDNFDQENSVIAPAYAKARPEILDLNPGLFHFIVQRSQLQKDIPSLFFYRVTFSATITSTIRISFVCGIPAPKPIRGYSFPVHSGNRLWLFNEKDGRRNQAIQSAPNTVSVWNGSDVRSFLFGDDSDLTAGAGLLFVTQNGEQHFLLACKQHQTWGVVGVGPGDWTDPYLLSGSIGCVAPNTMRVIDMPIGNWPGPTRQVAIWVGADGVYPCDGATVSPAHTDIRNLFEEATFTSAQLAASTAFVDAALGEYHWCVASREFVLDYRRRGWFEVIRGTGKTLQCGVSVLDTNGAPYTYGFIDTGYMERLENGTDFDGTAIAATMQLSDLAFSGDPLLESTLHSIKLLCKQKALSGATITGTHYADTNATGTALTLSATKAGYRVADPIDQALYGPAIWHGLKFAVSSTDETVGFEPIALAVEYDVTGHDVTP